MSPVRNLLRDDDLTPAELLDVLDLDVAVKKDLWDEAENRLHAHKALLARLLEWS
jgi:ornithine carbamoyltransferase